MHNTEKKKAERLAREVRRHERKIEALRLGLLDWNDRTTTGARCRT